MSQRKALRPPVAFLSHRSADRRTSRDFSFLHTEAWIPKVSPDLTVRTILSIDIHCITPFLTVSVSLAKNNRFIRSLQLIRSALPQRSDIEHIFSVHALSEALFDRYKLSHDKEDLDKSIAHCTEAILLLPVSPVEPCFKDVTNVFRRLFHLADSLLERSRKFNQPEDLKYAIEYLQYLRGLPVDSFHDPTRIDLTAYLISALSEAILVESDGTHSIDEILVLFREFLTFDLSADFPEEVFYFLNLAVNADYRRGHVESLDAVIEHLRDAVKIYPPDSLFVLFSLAYVLRIRFNESHSNDDYEESMALFERVTDTNQPGKDFVRDMASPYAAFLAFDRSTFFNNPEYSEATISRLRISLGSSIDKRHRVKLANDLALLVNNRSKQYNLPEGLEEAKTYASHVVDLSSSENWNKLHYIPTSPVLQLCSITLMTEKIQQLEELLSNTPPRTDKHSTYLNYLAYWYSAKFNRTNDMSDLEESIKYRRLELEIVHPRQRNSPLISLQCLLFLAFEETNKIGYLEDSITAGYDIFELKNARHNHLDVVERLVQSLVARDQVLPSEKREDFHEAIRLISAVINDPYAQGPHRFQLSCQWAFMARSIGHPTALAAYKTAMSLMQKSLSFAPTVSVQHANHVALDWTCQTMPLDYASLHIVFGKFEEAVETLEQGRAILWSEMRGLRASANQIIDDDSPLAKRFTEINRELEALTVSVTPSGRQEMEDGNAQRRDGTDPFGRLLIKRRKLMEERDALVSQIQGLPGFEGFLTAPSFDTLRSAASRGPVILINHSEWRSDILIIFRNRLPCSIPTVYDFYHRANTLRDELSEAREHGLDSIEYQDALCSVLKDLYELVGESVIKTLQVSGVPEQSRVWWCPTSVFCSLPLHAMGPIPSSEPSKRYFSDFYIPSYTPSLSALIESRRASPKMQEKPSLLLVAHPEDSLPGVRGEIKVIKRAAVEARVTLARLVSSKSTPSTVIEGLRSSRFAHFACHGVLETGKPFDASFMLHAGSRLTLLDIVRSRLPDAEFAFLSCCHAAEITEDSIADEALHLTAAMQYGGFRSVVGTMWAMADTDGEDLAKSFYESLFSSRETDMPYYERSAHALRDATQKLRRKRGIKLERWVNFVHYGA